MARVVVGNASAITVPRGDRDGVRRFYREVLGGTIVKEDDEKDIFRLAEDFYILFRYGDVPDETEFLRSPRSLWLQIKSDSVAELAQRILEFGGRKIDLPLPDFYFQAPGGQCYQLLPIEEDQAYYKGAEGGQDIAGEMAAEAVKEQAMSELAAGYHQRSAR